VSVGLRPAGAVPWPVIVGAVGMRLQFLEEGVGRWSAVRLRPS